MQEAGGDMTYEDWLKAVPDDLKQDALWQFKVYPKTLFLYDLLWEDCTRRGDCQTNHSQRRFNWRQH